MRGVEVLLGPMIVVNKYHSSYYVAAMFYNEIYCTAYSY